MEKVDMRYAEALYELALEEDDLAAYYQDMQKVKDIFQADRQIIDFFAAALVSEKEKLALLEQTLEGQVGLYVLNFLKLLVKKKRIRWLIAICDDFKKKYLEHMGIVEGYVYSAMALDDAILTQIQSAISQKEKKQVQLQFVLDPSLLGGVKVVVGQHVYDGSLEARLGQLRAELLGSR